MSQRRPSVSVLCVDDEPGLAGLVGAYLERFDRRLTVTPAEGAREALERLAADEFDCVVSDYDMPEMDGLAFLEAVRAERPDLPFVMFTGCDSTEAVGDALDAGVTDYARKGSGTTQYRLLANRVRNAVARGRPTRDHAGFECGRERGAPPALPESVDALRRLYEVASDADVSFEEKRRELLAVGSAHLDLEYGFVTEIADATQTVVTATGDHELLQPGESCPLERSYCRRTVSNERGLLAVKSARETAAWVDDPGYDTFGLEAYVGGKILVDDRLYGTVCFAATESRRAFSEMERTFVELLSRWLSYELEQREHRAALEAQNAQLEEFARVVSHDLRNPLNVAEGRLELAAEECDPEHLRPVERAHARMRDLLENVLMVAREGEVVSELADVDLASVCESCWANVETGDAALAVETDRTVVADEGRLAQLVANLVRNSVEHGSADGRTRSGDRVEHGSTGDRAEPGDIAERRSAGSRTSPDDGVERDSTDDGTYSDGGDPVRVTVGDLPDGFYVEDNGVDIPDAERDRLFEAGYSTKSSGTGIGLRIVDRIADAHGWSVGVATGSAGGARFEIAGVDRA